MKALKEVIDYCAAEQGRQEVVTVPLSLVRLLGSAEEALFLAQLLAWTEREDAWVMRSYAQWTAATALPAGRVRAAARRCAALGILEVVAAPAGTGGERCYRVLMAPLLRLLIAGLRGETPVVPATTRYARRVPARRRLRLPLQAGAPARRPERVRRAAKTVPESRPLALPALVAVREIAAPPVRRKGAKAAAVSVAPARNGHQGARRRERPAQRSAGPFDAQRWAQALAELSRKVPADVYTRWLAGSRFSTVEGGTVVVAVDDMNTAWWLNTRLSRVVERAVNLVAPGKEWLAVEARAREL